MNGWQREIIDPIEALIAPRTLVWKEKYGTLRVEWVRNHDGTIVAADGFDMVLENASTLCCCACGRWHRWVQGADNEQAIVTNEPVRGWSLTLCQWCRDNANATPPA